MGFGELAFGTVPFLSLFCYVYIFCNPISCIMGHIKIFYKNNVRVSEYMTTRYRISGNFDEGKVWQIWRILAKSSNLKPFNISVLI